MSLKTEIIRQKIAETSIKLYNLEKMAEKLSTEERDKLSDDDFALPGRRYPIHDEAHARNALTRVAQFGTPEERAIVRAKVFARYPHLREEFEKKTGKEAFSEETLTVSRLGKLQGKESEAKSPRYKKAREKALKTPPEKKAVKTLRRFLLRKSSQ
jgi:hypothetical protein